MLYIIFILFIIIFTLLYCIYEIHFLSFLFIQFFILSSEFLTELYSVYGVTTPLTVHILLPIKYFVVLFLHIRVFHL